MRCNTIPVIHHHFRVQEEQAAVRADARAEVEGRRAEVDIVQARSRDQAKQLSEMFAMLQVRTSWPSAAQPDCIEHNGDHNVPAKHVPKKYRILFKCTQQAGCLMPDPWLKRDALYKMLCR